VTTLVLLPLFLAVFLTGGALAWPAAVAVERRRERAVEGRHVKLPAAPEPDLDDVGYPARHRLGDDGVLGSAAQRGVIAALRRDTEEFAAIVASSYRSGGLPAVIGQPGKAFLYAHMRAVAA
jgi:hypothetical protein